MGDSNTDEGKRLRKKEIQKMIRSRLTRNQRLLLSLFDLAMIAMLLTDMAFFVGLLKEPNLMLLAVLNLSVVAIGYVSYKMKRIISRRVVKDVLREGEEDTPKGTDEGVS